MNHISRQAASMELGQMLIKAGRTSGLTRGVVHELRGSFRFNDVPDQTFRAYEVMPVGGKHNWAEPGDSGALAFDRAGSWVGLVFGGHVDRGSGYVIPSDVVIRDIESRTGRELRLP